MAVDVNHLDLLQRQWPNQWTKLIKYHTLDIKERVKNFQTFSRIVESVFLTFKDEFDLTNLATLRQELKPMAAEFGIKLSYMPFIIKVIPL